jgi:hypothetical protein
MPDRILSFVQLSEALETFRSARWVFRGVCAPEHILVPKVGRIKGLAREEKRIFALFKREAPAFVPEVPSDDWELMALAQHHGLPTHLLDWTENPLVAAYFASDKNYDCDGVIYVMDNRNVVKEGHRSPFEIDTIMRYRPRHITRRIQAQRGLFTIHPDPETPLEVGTRSNIEIQRLVIDKAYKRDLIWDLARFAINRASLFPDLDGLAYHINWMYSMYDPAKAPPKPGKAPIKSCSRPPVGSIGTQH